MPPRVSPVEHPDAKQQELLDKAPSAPDGTPLNLMATLAHSPKLLRNVNMMAGYFIWHSTLPAREREIVILRAGGHARSPYELHQHRVIGAECGMTPEEIDAAADPSSTYAWGPADGALLRFTDELVTTDTVSDETWEGLSAFTDVERLDLLALVGFYRLVAGVLNWARIEIDEGIAQLAPHDPAARG
jgi:4-carboxymuconolactone decarboxylase